VKAGAADPLQALDERQSETVRDGYRRSMMPLVRIDLSKEAPPERVQVVSEAIYALVEVANVKKKFFHRIADEIHEKAHVRKEDIWINLADTNREDCHSETAKRNTGRSESCGSPGTSALSASKRHVKRPPTGFPLSAWAFALRIWAAMMMGLYAAFWLQFESASSAAITVSAFSPCRRGGRPIKRPSTGSSPPSSGLSRHL
jgi:hypothetical protein